MNCLVLSFPIHPVAAAIHSNRTYRNKISKPLNLLVYLQCKLARGRKDKCIEVPVLCFKNIIDYRKNICRSFTSTCLCACNQVMFLHDEWYGLFLDWCGVFITHRPD